MLSVSACAGPPVTLAPAEREVIARRVSGSWDGFIWGREMAQSAHQIDVPARVAIAPDGTWFLSSGLGASAGTISSLRDGVLELDGRAEAGAVWLRLHLMRDGSLMGLVHTHFSGRTVVTNIHLWRPDPSRGPAPQTMPSPVDPLE